MIIFAKTETAKADFAKLTPDLKNLFSKAKISV
jgi:RNase P protein component